MAKKKSTAAEDILHIGIDLGTSRSAVAASNGKREWVESYVAWPRDFVAQKLLGERILFGEEAIKNRMSVNMVRPLENGVIREGTARDEEAVRELIHYLIEKVGAGDGKKIHAAVGVPAEALKVNKLAIRNAVREYADALMVVSEPFAVAYGLDALNNAMIIDVGAGTVDFCVMLGTMPAEEDQRSLLTAGDSIDRRLRALLESNHPEARFSETFVRDLKEKYAFVGGASGKVKVQVPVEGKFTEYDISSEIEAACGSIVAPIIETAIDLISRYEPEFQEAVRQNIYLAGGGSQIRGFADAIEEGLKEYGIVKVHSVDDPLFSGAAGALALAQDMPEEYWEDM
ncbi:MAG: rod shape-determining protein [Bacteroidota bacterium]